MAKAARKPHHPNLRRKPYAPSCGRRPRDPLDTPVLALNHLDDEADQLLKDKIHARLHDANRSCTDPITGCWLYLGSWNDTGQALIRVGAKTHPVSRVGAWLYKEDVRFELWGENTAVRTCENPACFNPKHLIVFPDRASAWQHLLREGKVGVSKAARRKRLGKPPRPAA